jgi:hypothetical protein
MLHAWSNHMTKRITVTTFLTSVISMMSAAIVGVLLLNALGSFERVKTADRLAAVAQASATSFKALHNLRTVRTMTIRILDIDTPVEPALAGYLAKTRETERAGLNSLLEALPLVEFPGENPARSLASQVGEVAELESATSEAMKRPKAERPDGLAKRYSDASLALFARLDNLGSDLAALASRQDAVVDQMLALKQAAWLLRNSRGETTTLVSQSVEGARPTPADQKRYERLLGNVQMAWSSIDGLVSKKPLPPRLVEAIAASQKGYFEPSYIALRDRLFNAPLQGEKPEMDVAQWVNFSVARLATGRRRTGRRARTRDSPASRRHVEPPSATAALVGRCHSIGRERGGGAPHRDQTPGDNSERDAGARCRKPFGGDAVRRKA